MTHHKSITHGMAIEINPESTELIKEISISVDNALDINLGWLKCLFKSPNDLTRHFYSDDRLIAVIDGYLTGLENNIKHISEILIENPTKASQLLKGSFFLCIIVLQQRKAIFLPTEETPEVITMHKTAWDT